MKALLSTILLLMAVLVAQAQSARDDFQRDIHLSASNYTAYPGPKQHQLSPAPKGIKPFYISHYGRHGSRYLINTKTYDRSFSVLSQADSAGKLSPLGKDVLKRVAAIREEARGRHGELTQLGAEQHRQIAQRMYQRFPEVFAGNAHVDARSTVVIRCILSMENALQQLLLCNPKLQISHDASHHDMYYMNQQDKALYEKKADSAAWAAYKVYAGKRPTHRRVVDALFSDTAYVSRHVDAERLSNNLFKLASNLQSSELRRTMTLYDLFTDDEIYQNWQKENCYWYITYGGCTLNGGTQPYSQRNLLRRIIHEADSCIALGRPCASLRFGHETMVMPLTCLLELDDYGLATDNLESLERKGWLNYRIFPMAANVQLIFYRKDAKDKNVLVKVLLNENEMRLPLKSKMAPYYKWSDFKAYYLKKLDDYEATLN